MLVITGIKNEDTIFYFTIYGHKDNYIMALYNSKLIWSCNAGVYLRVHAHACIIDPCFVDPLYGTYNCTSK